MNPTSRAAWLLGAASLVFVGSFVAPSLVWVGGALDVLILGLVVWDARRARAAPLVVRRRVEAVVHQAEPVEVALEVDNPGARPLVLLLRDPLAPELGAPWAEPVLVPAGHRVVRARVVRPARRGTATLGAVVARVTGPLGLGTADREVVASTDVRVLPQARFSGEEGIHFRRLYDQRTGRHLAGRRGLSTELHALRDYHWGDDLRRVHWKQTARLRRPVVAETTWEQHQSLVLLLDAGRPMAALAGDVPKLDRALAVMLALLRLATKERDTVSLVLFSREVRAVVRVDGAPASWRPTFERLHAEAADLDEPDYLAPVAWCARHVPRRSLVLLCTSVSEALGAERLATALRALGQRHRAVLVNLEDPGLVALARGTPETVEDAYARVAAMSVEARSAGLYGSLRAQGVDVVTTPAEGLLTGVLQAWLDRRGSAA